MSIEAGQQGITHNIQIYAIKVIQKHSKGFITTKTRN